MITLFKNQFTFFKYYIYSYVKRIYIYIILLDNTIIKTH